MKINVNTLLRAVEAFQVKPGKWHDPIKYKLKQTQLKKFILNFPTGFKSASKRKYSQI